MRLKSREVSDFNEIIDILERCNVLRIAFKGDEYPYIVPVSFGIKKNGDNIVIYFHGAKEGHKIEQIEKYPMVCIEGDIFYKAEETSYGITSKYESVIGYGIIEKVNNDEIIDGLKAICAHYNYKEYPIEKCKTLSMTAVYKIKINELTGKRKLPEEHQVK